MFDPVCMPDGSHFPFWDDETHYQRTYHVACRHPAATDDGPGSETEPFASINHAAKVLQPGERVIVHEGVYRECVRPARGGQSASQMIAYQAAPNELVVASPELMSSASAWRTQSSVPGGRVALGVMVLKFGFMFVLF